MNEATAPFRIPNPVDQALSQVDRALRTCFARSPGSSDSPAQGLPEPELSDANRRHAAGLMRINHVGEVCAQALYDGQALWARRPEVEAQLRSAAEEETRHLNWCDERLKALGAAPSLLNPLWYAGSFVLGTIAGIAGDPWSLGFVVETERQVEAHLKEHLERLPEADEPSRSVVRQMIEDEARHGTEAKEAGGETLPAPVRGAMAATARVMKLLAYRI
ncbi:MAG: 2-polyprenyl-3-methyl-6-methoxy-1,4-benzoquinone monooxygenase [Pseudomonadota bacterium]